VVGRYTHPFDEPAAVGLRAANLGDNGDTTGAVYGQLAGAYYGEQMIPHTWRSRLTYRELIEQYAEELLVLSQST